MPSNVETIVAFELSKAHFELSTNIVNKRITSLTIPNDNNTSYGDSGYLVVQTRNEDGSLINQFISTNSSGLTTNGERKYTFFFDDFILPENYSFLRFILIDENEITDEEIQIGTRRIRANVISKDEINDLNIDDACKVYWSSTNPKDMVVAFEVSYSPSIVSYTEYKSLLDRVTQLEILITQLTSNQ